MSGPREGRVVEFDEVTGLGAVDGPDGRLVFHCVEIADGSRTIEVGTPVEYDLLPKLGRLEAANLRP